MNLSPRPTAKHLGSGNAVSKTEKELIKTGNHPNLKRRFAKFAAPLAVAAAFVASTIGLSTFAKASVDSAATPGAVKVADPATDTLHDTTGTTEEVGRVKTDKTVRPFGFTGVERDGTVTGEHEIGDDFMVTLSGLSSGGVVYTETISPVDVVFVLDFSGSMAWRFGGQYDTTGEYRYVTMVNAANAFIEDLMSANENNRIGIVAYSGNTNTTATTTILMPLDHYRKTSSTTDYLTIGSSGGTPRITARGIGDSVGSVSANRNVTGGTNTEAGLFQGMTMLNNVSDTQVDVGGLILDRLPSLILMSDGQPTFSANTGSYWAQTATTAVIGAGSGDYAGNGFTTALVGKYMKQQVNKNYESDLQVYTVGLGAEIVGSEGDTHDLAVAALNPEVGLAASNTMADTINGYMETYNSGSSVTVVTGANNSHRLTINHPDTDDVTDLFYVDEYFEATSADELSEKFNTALRTILEKAVHSPIETDESIHGDGALSGAYLVFHDTTGEYMEVRPSIDDTFVLYVDHKEGSDTYGEPARYHPVSITEGADKDVYVFEAEVHSSWFFDYEEENLSSLIMEVEHQGTHDEITWMIPVELLPMTDYTVSRNADGSVKSVTRNEDTRPIKLNYRVGPMADAMLLIANPSIPQESLSEEMRALSEEEFAQYKAELQAYIDANRTDDGKSVELYANSVGDADQEVPYAEFEVNHFNNYYSFVVDTPLYVDQNLTTPLTASTYSPTGTYWYERDVYTLGQSGSAAVEEAALSVSNIPSTSLTTDSSGHYLARAGSRKGVPNDEAKSENTTDTASWHLHSHWDDGAILHQHQGNNGLLTVPLPAELYVTKDLTYEGLDSSQLADSVLEQAFEFTLAVTGGGSSASDVYTLTITEPDEDPVVTTVTNGGSFSLTTHQTARITGLPAGATYSVSETQNLPSGYSLVSPTSGTAAGQTESGGSYTAEFVNNYSLEPLTVQDVPETRKVLEGRPLTDDDVFQIDVVPYPDNPDIDATSPACPTPSPLELSGADSLDGSTIEDCFAGVTFSEPGRYRFRITERTGSIVGITYSQSVYAYTVVVADNGDGTMVIEDSYMEKTVDKDGRSVPQDDPERIVTDGVATFTNSYNTDVATIGTLGLKTYTDTTGLNPLTAGMFEFELRPSFYDENGNPLDQAVIDAVPMPADTPSDVYTETDQDGNTFSYTKIDTFNSNSGDFGFGTIDYDVTDVGNTYRYVVQEIIPDTALENGTRCYAMRSDPSQTVTTTEDHGYLWHRDGEIWDLKTISHQGFIYDCSRHVVVVAVSEDSGHIIADVQFQTEASQAENQVVINNIYDPTPATLQLQFAKRLDGRDMLDDETFSFTFEARDKATRDAISAGYVVMPTDTGESVSGLSAGVASNTLSFDAIEFLRPGTYRFSIRETADSSLTGITQDPSIIVAVVQVETDTATGELVADVTYNKMDDTEADPYYTFVNSFTDTVSYATSGAIRVEKKLEGRDLKAGEFEFAIEPQGDAPSIQEDNSFTNVASPESIYSGESRYTGLHFTQDDASKTYTYKVHEVVPATPDSRIGYDETEHTVSFKVEIIDAVLTVTSWLDDDTENAVVSTANSSNHVTVRFDNDYSYAQITSAFPTLYKAIVGRDWIEGDEFTFTLTAESTNPPGAELPETTTATSAAAAGSHQAAPINFGAITFSEPGTYRFRVTEVLPAGVTPENPVKDGLSYDTDPIFVSFEVVDDGEGNLVATPTIAGGRNTFTNSYHAEVELAAIQASKVLTGRAMRDREFMIDVRPVDVEGGASAEETGERFNVRETGETFTFGAASAGSAATVSVIDEVALTNEDVGTVYAFELREFVPSDAVATELDGEEYLMRDGLYYNTNGIDHWRAEVSVADNGDGTLSATVTWIAHDADHNVIEGKGGSVTQTTGAAPSQATLPFENTYSALGTATINAIKDVDGRDWTAEDSYSFEIFRMILDEDGNTLVVPTADQEAQIGSPLPAYPIVATQDTAMVGSDGSQHQAVVDSEADPLVYGWKIEITQDMLKADAAGNMEADFYYGIREIVPDDAVNGDGITYADATPEQRAAGGFVKEGMTYSSTSRYVRIHAQNTNSGTVTTDVDYVNADAPDVELGFTPVFTNRYGATGDVDLKVQKVLSPDGSTWEDAYAFAFELVPLRSGIPMPEGAAQTATKTISKDDADTDYTVSFGTLTFTQPGTYIYLIQETSTVAGVANDPAPQRFVEIVVSDDGEGGLTPVTTIYTDAARTQEQGGDDDETSVFTNTVIPPEQFMNVRATKVWDDDDDALGMRDTARLRLVGRAGGSIVFCSEPTDIAPDATGEALTVTWTHVPVKHGDATIAYSAEEDAIFGYATSVTGSAANGFTVTNTLTAAPAEISVSKEWDDKDDWDDIRPDSVTYQLKQKIGNDGDVTDYGDPVPVTIDDDNPTAAYTWTDLPFEATVETEVDGETVETVVPIYYSVEESDVPEGYTARVLSAAPGEFKVVNSHTPEPETIEVTKVWADEDDEAGARPDHVVVNLVDASGNTVRTIIITENDEGEWTGSFENLPPADYSEYDVEEMFVATGYSSAVTGDAENGFIVTNSYNNTVDLRATKVWDDGDQTSPEHAAVVLHLMKQVPGSAATEVADGTRTIPAGATGDALTVSWEGLPSVEGGLPVTYSLTEEPIENYLASISAFEPVDGEPGTYALTVTNSYREPPAPETFITLTFVDYLNDPEGQVLLYRRITPEEYADIQNTYEANKPADPLHEDCSFQQWDHNESTDDEGDILVTYVAQFQFQGDREVTVSYIDPLAPTGSELVKSEKTTDPSSVTEPDKPGHDGYTFVKWTDVEDAGGNIVHAAVYEKVCPECPPSQVCPDPAPTPLPAPTPAPAPSPSKRTSTPDTGDPTSFLPAAAMLAAGAAAVIAGIRSRRR